MEYDIIVVGGGLNGLGAAGYLAKAGKKVLLLERNPLIGGGVVTEERTVPGFRHDRHSTSHILIHGNPLLRNDELGLFSKFGLEYRYSETAAAAIFEDGSACCLHRSIDRTCESLAQFSTRDADSYRRFAEWGARMLPMMMMGMFTIPTPMGPFISLLEQSEDGRDLLDLMLRSPLQIVNDLFEHDKNKMLFLKLISEGTLQFPDDMGTGLGFALMPAFIHAFRFGRPVGGSGMLSQAVGKAIRHYGGEIRENCDVVRIHTSGGRATGVETKDGERFTAKSAVIACIHPKVLHNFVDGLTPSLKARIKRGQPSPYTLFKIDAAMNEPLRYNAPDSEVSGGGMRELIFGENLTEFLQSFDALRHGKMDWERPLINASNSAGSDETRCPPGKGVLFSVTYVPYHLADGGPAKWDEIKERVADNTLEKARKFVPNLTSANLIARTVDSPLDIERYNPNSFLEGDICGLGFQFFHTGGLRPIPELAQYAVPGIDKLYLCGPFMHPGGSVFAAGRPVAIKVCQDLGIDFDRVVAN